MPDKRTPSKHPKTARGRRGSPKLEENIDEGRDRDFALGRLMSDLTNLVVGEDIAVLVLNRELRVQHFTPAAGMLLNLTPADLDRPFRVIASNLEDLNWTELFSRVTAHGQIVEREVNHCNGRRYSMRLRPYRASDQTIEGVLVAMLDADAIHRARQEAEEARLRSESILNSLTAHIAVLAPDGTILETNRAWNRFAEENGNGFPLAVGPGHELFGYVPACCRLGTS